MKIIVLLTGLVLAVGVYVISSMSGGGGGIVCAADIKILQQVDARLTGALENATCPDYEGMVIEASDEKGNFLFSDITAMRISVEENSQEDGETQQTWKVLSAKKHGDAVSRTSFLALSVRILQQKSN